MSTQDKCCTLGPYFNVPAGNLEAFKQLCEQFVKKTSEETKCLYYGFSFDGNQVHCREGYKDADGLLAHLENVGSLLEEALKIAKLPAWRSTGRRWNWRSFASLYPNQDRNFSPWNMDSFGKTPCQKGCKKHDNLLQRQLNGIRYPMPYFLPCKIEKKE